MVGGGGGGTFSNNRRPGGLGVKEHVRAPAGSNLSVICKASAHKSSSDNRSQLSMNRQQNAVSL